MTTERQNWIPKYENGRFVVIDKLTNEVINTSQAMALHLKKSVGTGFGICNSK